MSESNADIADQVFEFNRDRIPKLIRLKYRRMSEDPFAFFRGANHLFAHHWTRLAPPDVGPAVLICGDLHLENFGAYRSCEGEFLYDINDFDDALMAPCGLDVARCTTSILLATQNWQYTPVQAMRTLLAFLDEYRLTIASFAATGETGEIALGSERGPIWELLNRPAAGDAGAFIARLTEATRSGGRRIERTSGRFGAIGSQRQDQIRDAVERHARDSGNRDLRVLDSAFRVAGIGSLGLERYAVLVQTSRTPGTERLLDIKEVRPSALLPVAGDVVQPDFGPAEARRTVFAQRMLQSREAAGLDVLELDGRWYRLHELVPEENRTGLDQLRKRPKRFRRAVAIAGRLTAWAHLRGSRLSKEPTALELARWAEGAGLEAVIASAVRNADQTRQDYKAFRTTMSKVKERPIGE